MNAIEQETLLDVYMKAMKSAGAEPSRAAA
jgi:hypothetical protein